MVRRGFVIAAVATIGGAILGGVGILVGAFVRATSRWPVRSAKKWVALCHLNELEPGKPLAASFTFQRLEGWYVEKVTRLVYVTKDEKGQPTVFSRRCTHLGCPVSWRELTNKFHCACHGGEFDVRGNVVKKPPARPLDVFECRIAGDMVEVAEA